MSGTCAVPVWKYVTSWRSKMEPCGKPAKGALVDGTEARGVHIGAEKRRATADAKYAAERAASAARRSLAEAHIAEIKSLAPDLSPGFYRPSGGPLSDFGGNPAFVVVDYEALVAILRERS
jgi:hypothetical protein